MKDRKLEKQLLKYIKFSPKIVFDRTDTNFFFTEDYAKVYKIFSTYFITFGGIPTDNILDAHFSEPRLLAIAKEVIDGKTGNMDIAELEFLINRLSELQIARSLEPMILDAVDEMGQGHGYEALEIVERGLINIQRSQRRTIREGDEIEGDINASLFEREKDLASDKKDERVYYLGFPEFDRFSGGIREGQLINFVAPTGHGKSITLMNIGCNMYNAGLNVVYVLLEMERREWELRYDSWLTGIRFRKLYSGKLSKEEWKQYKEIQVASLLEPDENKDFMKWLKRVGKKHLVSMSSKEFVHEFMGDCQFRNNIYYPLDIPRGCTMELLETRVNYIRQKHGCDVLLVDYPGIMQHQRGVEASWHDLEQLFKDLKELARFYRMPIICVAQGHEDEGSGDSRMTSGIVRFSKAILDHCDLCLAWNNNIEDVRDRRMVMKPLKTRNISSNFEIEFSVNLDVMRVTEDNLRQF